MAHSYRDLTCMWCGKEFNLDFAAEFCGDCINPSERKWLTHTNWVNGLRNRVDELEEKNKLFIDYLIERKADLEKFAQDMK